MAAYAKINNALAINNGAAVNQPDAGNSLTNTYDPAGVVTLGDAVAMSGVLKNKYTVGASGGWARPGSDIA